jgi:hypothetical protein
MHDLTTCLSNFAIQAKNRAASCRKDAAEERAKPTTGWEQYDRQAEFKARQCEAEAARWDARAAAARDGLLLVDLEDPGFEIEFSDLVNHARSEHRVVEVQPAPGGQFTSVSPTV